MTNSKKSVNLIVKRTIAWFLVIVSLLTCANLSGVATFAKTAFANTGSGQIDIKKGHSYSLGWDYIYGKSNNAKSAIDSYSRSFAVGVNNASDTTNMLRKYVKNGKGDHVAPSDDSVPIYRLSRNNGYTDSDEGASTTVKNYVTANDYSALTSNTSYLSAGQADMIRKVLYYGLAQFTQHGTDAQNCYFMATQALIWEISEGKRTGWGNGYKYSGTDNAAYLTNATNKYAQRNDSIKASYAVNNNTSYVFYWHDWYYTNYNKYFVGKPDYYQQILTDCDNHDGNTSNLNFTTPNAKSNYTENNARPENVFLPDTGSATCYDAVWDSSQNAYVFTMTLTNASIGGGQGQYDTSKLKVQFQYDGTNWTTLSSGKYSVSSSGNTVTVLIKDFDESQGTRWNAIQNCQYRLVWEENVINDYNKASFLQTEKRDYVNCGRWSVPHVKYLKLMTYVQKVEYKCNVSPDGEQGYEYLGNEIVHKGATPAHAPNHNHTSTNKKDYDDNGWWNAGTNLGTGYTGYLGVVNTPIYWDTTFSRNYQVVNKYTLSIYCDYCGQLIYFNTVRSDTSVALPSDEIWSQHFTQYHGSSEKYSSIENDGKYYYSNDMSNDSGYINNQSIKLTADTVLFCGHKVFADLTFNCDVNEAINYYDGCNGIDYNSNKVSENIEVNRVKHIQVGNNGESTTTTYKLCEAHDHRTKINDTETIFVGWAEKIIDQIIYETDGNGNIKYNSSGQPVVKETKWHYDNYIPFDQFSRHHITLSENKTYYGVYLVNPIRNVKVNAYDINEYIDNDLSTDGLKTLFESESSNFNEFSSYKTYFEKVLNKSFSFITDDLIKDKEKINKLYSKTTFKNYGEESECFSKNIVNLYYYMKDSFKTKRKNENGTYTYSGYYLNNNNLCSNSLYNFMRYTIADNNIVISLLYYKKTNPNNVNVKCVDIDSLKITGNNNPLDNLTVISSKDKNYKYYNKLNSYNYKNLTKDFKLDTYIPIDDNNVYEYTGQYYTDSLKYNSNIISHHKNKLLNSTNDLFKAESFKNEFYTNHYVDRDETIYVFYKKKDLLTANIQFVDIDKFIQNDYKFDDSVYFKESQGQKLVKGDMYSLTDIFDIKDNYQEQEINDKYLLNLDYKYTGQYCTSSDNVSSKDNLNNAKLTDDYFTKYKADSNKTIYLFYKKNVESKAINENVHFIDYDAFVNNDYNATEFETINSKSKNYELKGDSTNINLTKDFDLKEKFQNTIDETSCMFDQVNTGYEYTWNNKYFIGDMSAVKSEDDLSKADSFNDSVFTNHNVSQNEDVYIFYTKKKIEPTDTATRINVIVTGVEKNYLYGYDKNDSNKTHNLKAKLYYKDSNGKLMYDWDGTDTSSITLSAPESIPSNEVVEHLPNDLKANYVSWYQFNYSTEKDTELAKMLKDRLQVGAEIVDENGYCDYTLVDMTETYAENHKTLNLVFNADASFKVQYQFVDENGNPVKEASIETVTNRNQIDKLNSNAKNSSYGNQGNNIKDLISGKYDSQFVNDRLFGDTINNLRDFDPYNDTSSSTDYAHAITDDNGYTSFITVPTSQIEENSVWGNHWVANYINGIDKDKNTQLNLDNVNLLDTEIYCSGNTETDWKELSYNTGETVYSKDFNEFNSKNLNLSNYVGESNYPNNVMVKTATSRQVKGNILIKYTVKTTPPPVTVNVHYNEDLFENNNDFDTSSFNINITPKDGKDHGDIDDNKLNPEFTDCKLDKEDVYYEQKHYVKGTSVKLDLKKFAFKMDLMATDVTVGNLPTKSSDSKEYTYNANNLTIDLYVDPKIDKGYNTLKFDIINNSSSSNRTLGYNNGIIPVYAKEKVAASGKLDSDRYYNYYLGNVYDNKSVSDNMYTYTYDDTLNISPTDGTLTSKGLNNTLVKKQVSTDKLSGIYGSSASQGFPQLSFFNTQEETIHGNLYSDYDNWKNLKLETNLDASKYYVTVKYYTPYMLYYYIEQNCSKDDLKKLQSNDISKSDALDIICKVFNAKDEDKDFFKEHLNEFMFFANYKTYLEQSAINNKVLYKKAQNGFGNKYKNIATELKKSYEQYNKDFSNYIVSDKVYDLVRTLALKGYDYSFKANDRALSDGYNGIDINLAKGFKNTVKGLVPQSDRATNYQDSYYYAMIEVQDAPTIQFDINLPSKSLGNNVSLKDVVTFRGRQITNHDKKYYFSVEDFYQSVVGNVNSYVFAALPISDIFAVNNQNDPTNISKLNNQGLLINSQNDGKNTDAYHYKAVGWGSSKDVAQSKRIFACDNELNYSDYEKGIIKINSTEVDSSKLIYGTYETGNTFDLMNSCKQVEKLLDQVAEKNSDHKYTLYLNWVGLPNVENIDKEYTIKESEKLDFKTILGDTTEFTASELQNGTEMKNLTSMRNYSSQKEFDKTVKNNIKGVTTDNEELAGCEFKVGSINGEPFTTVDEFINKINSIDKDYLKKYGEVYVDESGDEYYKIPCTYDIEYWDDEHTDSYKWSDNGENHSIDVNSPKQRASTITFWIASKKTTAKEIRFISSKYFENDKNELVSWEDGGLRENSKWRNNQTLRLELRDILSFNDESKSRVIQRPQYEFTVSDKEIKELKKYISKYTDENGIDSYCDDRMLKNIYDKYIANH